MFQKLLASTVMMFDRLYKRLYPNDKNDLITSMLNDYSETEMLLDEFMEIRGRKVLEEIYIIFNNFYISELWKQITKWDDLEISKLKYLHILLLDIKNTLNNNSETNA